MITKSEIQLVRSLADKRARTETGLFLAEGEKLIRELRASDLRIERIYALDGLFSGPEVTPVSPKEMERLSHLKTPGSSLALVRMPHRDLRSADPAGGLVLALDDVQNPGNMGTIIRLADWFGIGDIVCSEATADCFNPKVVQATMGAILRVRVHYTDLGHYLAAHAAAGIPVYAQKGKGGGIRLMDQFVLDKALLSRAQQDEILFALQAILATGGTEERETLSQLSALFRREGTSVLCEASITFAQAALGAELEIPTIDGKVSYTLPEGTQTGTTFRLKGKGIPVVNGRGRGDQFVTVHIETPRGLNREQKEALRKFSDTLKEHNYKERKSFFDMFKK